MILLLIVGILVYLFMGMLLCRLFCKIWRADYGFVGGWNEFMMLACFWPVMCVLVIGAIVTNVLVEAGCYLARGCYSLSKGGFCCINRILTRFWNWVLYKD